MSTETDRSFDWRKGRAVVGQVSESARIDECKICVKCLEKTEEEERAWKNVYDRIRLKRDEYESSNINSGVAKCMSYLNDPLLGPLVALWHLGSSKIKFERIKKMNLQEQAEKSEWIELVKKNEPLDNYFAQKVLRDEIITPDDFEPGRHGGYEHGNQIDVAVAVWHSMIQTGPMGAGADQFHTILPYVVFLNREESYKAIEALLAHLDRVGWWTGLHDEFRTELTMKIVKNTKESDGPCQKRNLK